MIKGDSKMKKKCMFTLGALLVVLSMAACNDDAPSESKQDTVENYERTDEKTEELYSSYEEDQENVDYTISDVEAEFIPGMDYVTYTEKMFGNLLVAETFLDESNGDNLDVIIAKDGFAGILVHPDDGIKEVIQFNDLYEAEEYLN